MAPEPLTDDDRELIDLARLADMEPEAVAS